MATLTSSEKTKIRNFVEAKARELGISITWGKPALDAASQAVEDLVASSNTAISNAIDTATQPFGITFTATQKKYIVAITLFVKYLRDSV